MKVKSIEAAGLADVYNMEVEDIHDFAVENGVIVHNCFDTMRYVCAVNPISSVAPVPDKIKVYNPLDDDDVPRRRMIYL